MKQLKEKFKNFVRHIYKRLFCKINARLKLSY